MNWGVFIPAYQAAKTLPDLLARIPDSVWEQCRTVVLVDDGSRDDTQAVAEAWSLRQARLRYLRSENNQGYGAAVLRGINHCRDAGCDFAVCLHADGQYPPEAIADGIALMQARHWDLLQGSRHLAGTALAGGMPFYKFVAGRMLTAMENLCFGLRMTDYHSGFLIYGPRALAEIPFSKLNGYFDFDLEAIATARARGLSVGEMAIPTRYADEISHLNPWRYGLRALVVMGRYGRGYYGRL